MAFTITVLVLVLLAALFIWALKPRKRRDTSRFEKKVYAHRGLYDNNNGIPENSLAAFKRARVHQYGVELDVQLTKDGKVVVFHDDTLNRMCGVDGHIYDFTYVQLRQFRLLKTGERIPLFTDVLEELDGVPVICEIKVPAGTSAAAISEKAAPMIDGYKGDICVESFDPRAVQWFRKNRPELIRGQLSMNFMKDRCGQPILFCFAMTHLLVNVLGRPDFIAYGVDLGAPVGFQVCRSWFRPMLAAWTVTSQDQQDQLVKVFDAIIFEQYFAKKIG